MDLSGKKIAILATNGFEQSELEVPRDRLKQAGASVEIVSPAGGEIKGWDQKDWADQSRWTRPSTRHRRRITTRWCCRADKSTQTCCVSSQGR